VTVEGGRRLRRFTDAAGPQGGLSGSPDLSRADRSGVGLVHRFIPHRYGDRFQSFSDGYGVAIYGGGTEASGNHRRVKLEALLPDVAVVEGAGDTENFAVIGDLMFWLWFLGLAMTHF